MDKCIQRGKNLQQSAFLPFFLYKVKLYCDNSKKSIQVCQQGMHVCKLIYVYIAKWQLHKKMRKGTALTVLAETFCATA